MRFVAEAAEAMAGGDEAGEGRQAEQAPEPAARPLGGARQAARQEQPETRRRRGHGRCQQRAGREEGQQGGNHSVPPSAVDFIGSASFVMS